MKAHQIPDEAKEMQVKSSHSGGGGSKRGGAGAAAAARAAAAAAAGGAAKTAWVEKSNQLRDAMRAARE
jgi:hypothetical protein